MSTTKRGEQRRSVHIHYCSRDFTRKSTLAALAVIQGIPTATNITEVLLSNVTTFLGIEEEQLSKEHLATKLVCIATDRCEVMMGAHTGVHVRGPFAVVVHDYRNRAALSSATLEKCMLLQRDLGELCSPAYSVFHSSGASRWELKQCQILAGWPVQQLGMVPINMQRLDRLAMTHHSAAHRRTSLLCCYG